MILSARAREILGLTLVVLLVVAVATAAHLATVARLTLGSAADEGHLLSRQLLHQAAHVIQTAGNPTSAALTEDPAGFERARTAISSRIALARRN